MAIFFGIERSGSVFSARADGGDEFFVGVMTSFTDKTTGEDFEGLFNVPAKSLPKLLYKADDFHPTFGFWSDFVEPTAICEGRNFLTLNTYDRARFTWGFGQFGAHVPDGDFVRFFRDLLGRPEASDYFPNLKIKDGRVVKVDGDDEVALETALGTGPLLDYLNPSTSAVEDAEVVAAAKLIHWTTFHDEARQLQVLHMIDTFKRLQRQADERLGLDGQTADVCCVVCDVLHQGRGRYKTLLQALTASNPLAALLDIGRVTYPERIATLRTELAARGALFGSLRWRRSIGDFAEAG
jgi:hypothetical protein